LENGGFTLGGFSVYRTGNHKDAINVGVFHRPHGGTKPIQSGNLWLGISTDIGMVAFAFLALRNWLAKMESI
jgi:hypothetical protein